MKQRDKMAYLADHHMGEWLKARQDAEKEISDKQPTFCVCGRLATGLHESGCRKYRDRVNALTVTKLKHLIPSKKKAA